MNGYEFQQLPEKSQRFLLYAARKMAEGWTGSWEVAVQNGGVRDFRESGPVNLDPQDAEVRKAG